MDLATLQNIWTGNEYYPMAEEAIEEQWQTIIWPCIQNCDFAAVVDLAAGIGRNSQKLLPYTKRLVIVDICESNLEVCRDRFAGAKNISYKLTDGKSIPVKDASTTLIYCWDAMVHFEVETVWEYLKEAYRALQVGGKAFFHHSNYVGTCNRDFRYNPYARNYMSKNLFDLMARRAGLTVDYSGVIRWGDIWDMDCVTLLSKGTEYNA
jgi:ubiquinone/menaquinone biosynthesis C-methylase UbiE